MYKYFVHAEGSDINGVRTQYHQVIEVPTNEFTALCNKLKKEFSLNEVTIVSFRNLGIVEDTNQEMEDDMAKKKILTKKPTAKKPATKVSK